VAAIGTESNSGTLALFPTGVLAITFQRFIYSAERQDFYETV